MHVCTLTHKFCTWLCPQHVTSVEIWRADTQGKLVRGGPSGDFIESSESWSCRCDGSTPKPLRVPRCPADCET